MRPSAFHWFELSIFMLPFLLGRRKDPVPDPGLPRSNGGLTSREGALGLLTGDEALVPKLAAKWENKAYDASRIYPNVPKALVLAVIHATSRGKVNAVGPNGEEGLMQLTPLEQERFGVADPFDGWDSIEGGTEYLSLLIDHYQGNLSRAVIAYDWGIPNTDAALKAKGMPPKDVMEFSKRVMALYGLYQKEISHAAN